MSESRQDGQFLSSIHRPSDAGREGQLRVARLMKSSGHIQQALHALDSLLDGYPGDPESRAAVEELESLARYCERRGMVYFALSLYKKLEQVQ